MKTSRAGQVWLTVLLGGLLSLLYVAIFSLSAQDADTSGDLSMRFTEKSMEMLTGLSGKESSASAVYQLAVKYEHFMRKLAHFTEYAVMGILVYLILGLWVERNWRAMLLNIGWVSVSAVFDELHQMFVPGRYSSPRDVLLDTAGGAFGIAAVFLTACCIRKLKGKRYSLLRTEYPPPSE